MPAQQMFLPPELQAEQTGVDRRRKLAEALMASSMQPIQGRQAGRFYVAPSPTEGLAKLFAAYAGGQSAKEADEQASGIARRAVDQRSAALAAALSGEPAKAGEGLVASGDPMLMGIGGNLMAKRLEREFAEPTKVDLGDRIGLMRNGVLVGYLTKAASPDARLRADTTLQTHQTPSGSAILTNQGAMQRHETPSGSAILTNQGAMQRHLTPSGSAVLQERGARERHLTPSGSAVLTAETTRRGQDQAVNPAIQGPLAQARAYGSEIGEGAAKAQIALPDAVAKAETAVGLIDQLIGTAGKTLKQGEKPVAPHPGFQSTVGATYLPGARFVEGSPQSDFMRRLEQIKGGAFLQAFETLKGGGQITVIEGEKATQAITRMDKAQSEGEFIAAAREFQDIIQKGVQRAKTRAAGSGITPSGYTGPERRGWGIRPLTPNG